MAKLILMQGLPGSGKSTRAEEIMKADGNAIRINRDTLRTMLHFDKWTGRKESMTREAARVLAHHFLLREMTVIIDDTNLNPEVVENWKHIAKKREAKIEYVRMDTSVEECIRRDSLREKNVGKHVITGMAMQYGLYPQPAKPFVLCDLDGTLADIRHRLQYAKGETKNWAKFFEGIPQDTVRWDTVKLLDEYIAKGHEIIIVSARPEHCRQATLEWMESTNLLGSMPEGGGKPFDYIALFMRGASDKRDDVIVKQQIYDTYFKDKYPVEVVIDDRPKVIRMWQSNGVPVIDVGAGVEF